MTYDDEESRVYKQQVIKAFEDQEESYNRAQRFILRPMRFNDKPPRRPFTNSDTIVALMKLEGESEIYIEDFVREYEGLHHALIRGMIGGVNYQGLSLPKEVEYAKMRNYKVLFRRGDVIRNPDFCIDDYHRFYKQD